MGKKLKMIYACIFFGLCLVPMALLPFFKNTLEIEKRGLKDMPALISDGSINENFSDGFEGWLSDHLPLRPYLLSAADLIKGEVLHAPSSNVITG
ncbi:MAG: hypothetical protein IJL97_00845, partial [Lachnospiraceae bacterium]|nr:hypothetical protein [Lachnospiraceae bacterium]